MGISQMLMKLAEGMATSCWIDVYKRQVFRLGQS